MKLSKPALSMLCAISLLGCSQHPAAPSITFTVTSYEAASRVWTVERVDSASKTRTEFALTCDFYEWGGHAPDTYPDACDLIPGETFADNLFPEHPDQFLSVSLDTAHMTILKDDPQDRVDEQFSIKEAHTLPYRGSN